jgi:tRNA(adenine34) deaminase
VPDSARDLEFMTRALELADRAAHWGEVPVGAVLVIDDEIIGEGWNQVIASADPTAHAECVALREAARHLENYRLSGSTLYVTLEPCTMCVGALVHARVERLVFAAREPRAGVVCSQRTALDEAFYNHRVQWSEGPLAQESAERLQAFFRKRR